MRIEDIDKGYDHIETEVKKLGTKDIEIGLWGTGSPDENLAYRGSIHEYGTEIKVTEKMRGFLGHIGLHLKATTKYITIPERSFMRSTYDKENKNWYSFFLKSMDQMYRGFWKASHVVDAVGQKVKSDIQTTIEKGDFKKLHDITKERKGSSKPLIDTGDMKNRIDYKVGK